MHIIRFCEYIQCNGLYNIYNNMHEINNKIKMKKLMYFDIKAKLPLQNNKILEHIPTVNKTT